jgi:hypothetical protein
LELHSARGIGLRVSGVVFLASRTCFDSTIARHIQSAHSQVLCNTEVPNGKEHFSSKILRQSTPCNRAKVPVSIFANLQN